MRQFKITNSITNRDGSTVEKYFTEVSKEPLLAPDQEMELARRIRQGDEEALEKLVRANLRFVVSVAKQYQYGKLPLNDLINEGNIGLIKAAKMFDETRGFKFISYAVWWIRQSIMHALAEHSRIVRVPANKIGEMFKINKAASVIEQQNEREATPEEIGEYLDMRPDDVRNIEGSFVKQSSLDAPFDEQEGNSLLDVLHNPHAETTDHSLDNIDSLKKELSRVLNVLNDREREIICRFYGINCDYSQSLEDIGEDLKLTRERVRQIKEVALRKLRVEASILQVFL